MLFQFVVQLMVCVMNLCLCFVRGWRVLLCYCVIVIVLLMVCVIVFLLIVSCFVS